MFNVDYTESEVSVFFRNFRKSLRYYRAYYARAVKVVIFSAFRTPSCSHTTQTTIFHSYLLSGFLYQLSIIWNLWLLIWCI